MLKRKSDIYNLILIFITVIIAVITYSKLPDIIPTHWNAIGQIDKYGPKEFMAFLVPGIMIVTWIGMRLLPYIDPRKSNYEKFQRSYSIVLSLLLTFFFLLYCITTAIALGYKIPVERVVPILVGFILVIMGNYLPKSRSNFFYGIKTPWTLSSEVSWNKTHRLGGKLFVLAGLAIIISCIVLPVKYIAIVTVVGGIVAGIIPVVASYFYAKK